MTKTIYLIWLAGHDPLYPRQKRKRCIFCTILKFLRMLNIILEKMKLAEQLAGKSDFLNILNEMLPKLKDIC